MKNWQKWIAFVLVMALPIAGFAGLSFEPHCDSHAQEISSSTDQGSADHCADDDQLSHRVNQTSQSEDCQCECSSHIACLGSVAVAITGITKTSFVNSGDPLIHYVPSQVFSLNLSTIFRPPILVS